MEEAGNEVVKWIVEGGAGGVAVLLSYYLFVRFIKKEVLEPIDEIRDLAKKAYKSSELAVEKVTAASFQMVTRTQDMESAINGQSANLQKVYSEMSHYAATSRLEVEQVKDELKSFEKATEEGFTKMTTVGSKLLNKIKVVETEVQKLGNDLMLIKNKKDVP